MTMDTAGRILVTGATGYIGGRLVPRLLQEGYRVRVLTRSQTRIRSRSWSDTVEVAVGDALDAPSLSTALAEVECAYYLIHSMARGTGFHELDIEAARLFGHAARQAGVRRIVYVGGLGDPRADLSQHLRSRQETGHALRESGVPVTEFRAAVIVGSGSISFELIRYLVERLPIMICPRWVYSRVQPIAVADLLDYLVAALTSTECEGKVIQVGGRDVTTYKGMMLGYAAARGLTRWLLPVPVLTPRLSSYWVHWVTPIPAKVSGPLIEGLRNEVVVTDKLAQRLFPHIQPQDYATALARVVAELDAGHIETAWSDAHSPSPTRDEFSRLESQQGMIVERRRRQVAAPASAVYRVLTGIGGQRGWYYANWAWRIRGIVDRLLGGVGAAPGAPPSRRVAGRRRPGLLAGRGPGSRSSGPSQSRNEASGPRLAPVRGAGHRGWDKPAGTDRSIPAQGTRRAGLLVRPVPRACPDLRRPGERDCQTLLCCRGEARHTTLSSLTISPIPIRRSLLPRPGRPARHPRHAHPHSVRHYPRLGSVDFCRVPGLSFCGSHMDAPCSSTTPDC